MAEKHKPKHRKQSGPTAGDVASAVGGMLVDGARTVFTPKQKKAEEEKINKDLQDYYEGQRRPALWPKSVLRDWDGLWDLIDREGWRIEEVGDFVIETDREGRTKRKFDPNKIILEKSPLSITAEASQHFLNRDETSPPSAYRAKSALGRYDYAIEDPRWIWPDAHAWTPSQLIGRTLFALELAYLLTGKPANGLEFPSFCYPPEHWLQSYSRTQSCDILIYFHVSCRGLDEAEKIRSLTTLANRIADEVASGRVVLSPNDQATLIQTLVVVVGMKDLSTAFDGRLRTMGKRERIAATSEPTSVSAEANAPWFPQEKWSKENETVAQFYNRTFALVPKEQRPNTTQLLEWDEIFHRNISGLMQDQKRYNRTGEGPAGQAKNISELFLIGPRRRSGSATDPS